VSEILEALERTAPPEDAGVHPAHGPVRRVSGLTGAGRAVRLLVAGEELPMTLVDVEADDAGPPSTASAS
jgi:hypothetical protein